MLLADRLFKRFGSRDVASGISIHVERGEAVALLGPNGAGKTTLFQMIAGTMAPDSGHIYLDGDEITDLPIHHRARRGLNYLPQEPSLFRGLSVEQNILLVIEAYEADVSLRRRLTDALLAQFNIAHIRHSRAAAISGGERRRCEIARTLAGRPSFVLFDEPFAGIDPIAIEEVRRLIRLLTAKGLGILISDHNIQDTLESVDRAYVINSGRIINEGSPKDIVRNSRARNVGRASRYT